MRAALALALLALSPAGREELRTAEASGSAALAGDLLAAKEQAKEDALRACVQRVAATLVTAGTEADQAQLLSARIYSRSIGYVRRFRILEEGQDGGSWTTTLRCEVSEARLEDDLLASGIAHQRAGMPRVLVLVAEQPISATQPVGWWQGGGRGDPPVLHGALVDRMERSGFTVVRPEALQEEEPRLENLGAELDPRQARELGVRTGAEIVVIGRAIAKPLGTLQLEHGAFHSAVAHVSARAVRTDTGTIVAAAELTGRPGRGFEQSTAGREALSEAGRQLASDLFSKVGRAWHAERSGVRRVAVAVTGVHDYARLAAFKRLMLQGVRGVNEVQERTIEGGRAEIDVTLAGTTRAFATDLATRRFPGFSVKVLRVTAEAVEVELR
jgi:hypothetical protein